MFAIIIRTKEVKFDDGKLAQMEDEKRYLARGEWGTVTQIFDGNIGVDALVFETEHSAIALAEGFKFHPWWIVKKDYELIKVEKRFKPVLDGYSIV
jgi:hypothetical protein